ncbi:MAG: hypothetical protein M3R11_00545 [Acidobacteriota bacterium]|nr:hypothetical protein [Acidobacteriota bacterium]
MPIKQDCQIYYEKAGKRKKFPLSDVRFINKTPFQVYLNLLNFRRGIRLKSLMRDKKLEKTFGLIFI